jgi:hypothetical protein
MARDEIREWKREQAEKGLHPMIAQPSYGRIVRLGPSGWGITVRKPDGGFVTHRLGGHLRFRFGPFTESS